MEIQNKKFVVLENASVIIPKGKPARVHIEERTSKDSKQYYNMWLYITEDIMPSIKDIAERSSKKLDFRGYDLSKRSTIGVRIDFGIKPSIFFDQKNKQLKFSSIADVVHKFGSDFSIAGILDGSYVTKDSYNSEERLNIRLKLDQVKVYDSVKRGEFNPADLLDY